MCGRLACTLAPEDISSACRYKDKNNKLQKPDWIPSCYDYKPFYNGPPTTVVAVLALKEHFTQLPKAEGEISLIPMRWGMIPPFKSQTSFLHTHNARIETVRESTMYKPSLNKGKRCIVVADGYYEWQTAKGEHFKEPYFVYQENKPDNDIEDADNDTIKHLIKLAGLFNIIKNENETKYTCTILTKEADKTMSWMHHRMPIILNTQQEIHKWLNYKDYPYESCLKEYEKESDKCMVNYYIVDKQYVNKSTCDDPKCMERISIKRKNTLDSWLKPKKPKQQ